MNRKAKVATLIMVLLSLVFASFTASAEDFTDETIMISLDQAMGYLEDETGIVPTMVRNEKDIPYALLIKWDTEDECQQLCSGTTFVFNPESVSLVDFYAIKEMAEDYNYAIRSKEAWIHLIDVSLYVGRNLEATDVAISFYPHEIGDGVAITGTSALIGNFKIDLYGDVWLLFTGDGYPVINEKSFLRIKESVNDFITTHNVDSVGT